MERDELHAHNVGMDEQAQMALRGRRRVQRAARASLIGLVGCFLILLLLEDRLAERAAIFRVVLIVCLLVHFGAVAFLRLKNCPACGERFLGSGARAFGSFTAMSQEECDHCGAKLTTARTGDWRDAR
jgi:hypothetical protein